MRIWQNLIHKTSLTNVISNGVVSMGSLLKIEKQAGHTDRSYLEYSNFFHPLLFIIITIRHVKSSYFFITLIDPYECQVLNITSGVFFF